jgi:ankyrin repeat protein
MEAGASANAIDENLRRTPLHLALRMPKLRSEVMGYLLTQGTDVSVLNFQNRTPLFSPLIHPHATLEMVQRFRHLSGKFDITDSNGNGPLHLVRSLRLARFLLASGADPATRTINGDSVSSDINVANLLW